MKNTVIKYVLLTDPYERKRIWKIPTGWIYEHCVLKTVNIIELSPSFISNIYIHDPDHLNEAFFSKMDDQNNDN